MKIAVAVLLTSLTSVRALQHPESPAQHCRHDAGPPWADDEENFGNKAYFDGSPAAAKGDCPAPLAAACSAKGKKAAFLDGPVDCGGKGWFCRIMPQAGWVNPDFDDNNFAMCNARDADERRKATRTLATKRSATRKKMRIQATRTPATRRRKTTRTSARTIRAGASTRGRGGASATTATGSRPRRASAARRRTRSACAHRRRASAPAREREHNPSLATAFAARASLPFPPSTTTSY